MKEMVKKCMVLFLSAILVIPAVQPGAVRAAAQDPPAADAGSAAPAATAGKEAVGIWKVVEMTSEEGSTTKEDIEKLESMGYVMYLDIREDGTLLASGFGNDTEGTWNKDTITMGGDPLPYTITESRLTIAHEGETMVFEKTTLEAVYAILGYKEGILDENVKYSEEEAVLLDKEEIAVKIVGYKADMTGFTATIRCENKTEHKLLVSTTTAVANKYVMDANWAASLDAKETKDTGLVFRPADLEKCGISAVDELILNLKVIDQEDWSMLLDGEKVTVYPTGKKEEDIRAAERRPVENEKILADNKDFLFVLQGAGEDPLYGFVVNCYFENRTDKKLTFMWSKCQLNGIDVTAYYADEAFSGTRGYSRAFVQASTLEEKGIEEVEEVRFILSVYDDADVPNKIFAEEFVYTP